MPKPKNEILSDKWKELGCPGDYTEKASNEYFLSMAKAIFYVLVEYGMINMSGLGKFVLIYGGKREVRFVHGLPVNLPLVFGLRWAIDEDLKAFTFPIIGEQITVKSPALPGWLSVRLRPRSATTKKGIATDPLKRRQALDKKKISSR